MTPSMRTLTPRSSRNVRYHPRASSGEVYAAGFGMLFGGLVLLGIAGALTGTAGRAIIGGIALCTVIIWYNADHK